MAMRKPFTPSAAIASGDGQPMTGMQGLPQLGRAGAQPMMPMGGTPNIGGAPGGPGAGGPGGLPQLAQPTMPQVPPPMAPNSGGPTAPGNIQSMLHAQLQGTQPGAPGAAGPSRVPVSMPGGGGGADPMGGGLPGMPGMAPGAGATAADPGVNGPTVMMRLLKSLGHL